MIAYKVFFGPAIAVIPVGSLSAEDAAFTLVVAGFTAGLTADADFAGAVAGFAWVWAIAAAVLAANNRISAVFLMASSFSGVVLLKKFSRRIRACTIHKRPTMIVGNAANRSASR